MKGQGAHSFQSKLSLQFISIQLPTEKASNKTATLMNWILNHSLKNSNSLKSAYDNETVTRDFLV